jgi:hypothetical protein
MTDNTDEELQKLREKESKGNRLDREDPQTQPDFIDALEEALDAVAEGKESDTVTAYDPRLAAVLEALEKEQQMKNVFEQLREAYDGNSGLTNPSKSAIIRLAVRVGFQEGTDSVLDDLEEAITRQQTTTV